MHGASLILPPSPLPPSFLSLSLSSLSFLSSQAFGVGALEDDDADDNVYGVESMTSYDVTLAGDGDMEMERKFGWTGGVEGQNSSFYFQY